MATPLGPIPWLVVPPHIHTSPLELFCSKEIKFMKCFKWVKLWIIPHSHECNLFAPSLQWQHPEDGAEETEDHSEVEEDWTNSSREDDHTHTPVTCLLSHRKKQRTSFLLDFFPCIQVSVQAVQNLEHISLTLVLIWRTYGSVTSWNSCRCY